MSIRRRYETTIIVNAALEDSDIESLLDKVSSYIENHGGTISELDRWGRRRLAYPINKKFNGYYVHFVFETVPSTIPILERFLVLEDTVLRHLSLLLPDRLYEYRRKKGLADGKAYGALFSASDSEDKLAQETRPKSEPAVENINIEKKDEAVDEQVEQI